MAHGISPYGVLPAAPGLSFANTFSPASESTIGYLPFWPVLLGGIYKLYALMGLQDRFLYYFMLKQPVILADALLGYFIFRFVRENRPEATGAVLAYWLLSPYTIIISGVWGMFDSLAMLPVVAALLVSRGSGRSVLEGIAIWAKSIPLIFALPLAFSGPNRYRNLTISLAVPLLGSLAIIALAGWPLPTALATLNSTVTKGGQSLSLFGLLYYLIELNVVGPAGQGLMTLVGYVWIPGEVAAVWLGYRWYGFSTKKGLVQSLLLCSIFFMLFKAQVNEQYAIYLLALTLIDVSVWSPGRKWLYTAITAVVLSFLLVNNVFLIRFTSPVYPGWSSAEAAVSNLMGQGRFGAELVLTLAFVGLNLFYLRSLYLGRTTSQRDARENPRTGEVVGPPIG